MKFSLALRLLLPALTTASPLRLFSKRITDINATTQNDLVNGTPCKTLTILFARGTTAPGNVGDILGPAFFKTVADKIGLANLAVQGVDYPANIFGFLAGGDNAGSATLASLINRANTQCPSTKLVVSGYSQGAQLVHKAADQISTANTAKISSVVLFGDPKNGDAVGTVPASKVKVFCNAGDNICTGGIIVNDAHRTYNLKAPEAVAFVLARAGL